MAFNRGCLVALAVLVLVGLACGATRTVNQKAYGLCTRDMVDNTLTMAFTLDLQENPAVAADPTGAVLVYQNRADQNCPIQLSTANQRWTANVKINLNNRQSVVNNQGCGFYYSSVTQAYTVRFEYVEFSGRHEVDLGRNRVYTMVCDESTTTDLVVNAHMEVTTPDLAQTVTPHKPDVKLVILASINNVFQEMSNGDSVVIGTPLKLRLKFNRGLFNANKPSHVGGTRCVVASTSNFADARPFLDDDSCTASAIAPTIGFHLPATGYAPTNVLNYRDTAEFPAFSSDLTSNTGSLLVYFKAYYRFCYGTIDSDASCNRPCPVRKRRATDVGADNSTSVTTHINIVLETEGGKQSSHGKDTAMYAAIGAVIGIGAMLCVILCVALIVFMGKRRRNRETEEKKTPPQAFVNENVNVPY